MIKQIFTSLDTLLPHIFGVLRFTSELSSQHQMFAELYGDKLPGPRPDCLYFRLGGCRTELEWILKRRDHLGVQGIDGKIILEWILGK